MVWFGALKDAWQRRRVVREFKNATGDHGEERYWAFRHAMMEAIELYERDHFARAEKIWNDARAAYPEQPIKSDLAIKLLMGLRLYGVAEEILLEGMNRYPKMQTYLEGLVRISYEKRDFAACDRYAAKMRKSFPLCTTGHLLAAASLSNQGDADEAERIIDKAIKLLPNDAAVLIEYAKLAERRGAWEIAKERWDLVWQTAKNKAAIAGAATALAHLGRHEEADALIEQYRYQSGTDHLIWLTFAKIAEIRGDWPLAADRWDFYRTRFPKQMFGYTQGLSALLHLKRMDEVETVLEQGIDQDVRSVEVYIRYAESARDRRDWPAMADRCDIALKQFPNHVRLKELGALALQQMRQS